jgi:formiminotetrahydrofolate cyclodeaminase
MADSFLDDLRRPRPDPGGGAAAAHGALLGMALVEKIALVEQRRASRKNGEDHTDHTWEALLRQALRLQVVFTRLRAEDVQAYHALAEVLKAGDDPDRLQDALDTAVQCPLRIMESSREALTLVEDAGKRCRQYLVADVLVACEFLGAAVEGAHHIAMANIPLVESPSVRERWLSELSQELVRGRERLAGVRAILEERNAAGSR